ncbi:sialidase family protein [Isoptericola sp. NPDC019482]|uniref:sialidase family protein n=1 Tax=Isoptericola sp. NPDC019482 TaxID=3154688 RepID=UPI0034886158
MSGGYTVTDRAPVPADGALYRDPRDGAAVALLPTPTASNHAPCLAPTSDGGLLAVWFGGSDEGNADIGIVQARLDPATGRWGDERRVTEDPVRAEQNPSLFRHPDGALWLVYTSMVARNTGVEETFNLQHTSVVRRRVSHDDGRTWSDPEEWFTRPGTFCRQPVQVLASGRWVFPQWLCFDDDTKNGSDVTVLQLSDDAGASWREVAVPGSRGRVHANVVELGPGELVALFRSRSADRIYLSRSTDDGDTWTEPEPTALPNNNAGLSAVRLPSGRLAVAYNAQSFNDVGGPVFWPFERSQVTVAVSDDGGRTWPVRRVVEPGDGFTGTGNLRSNHRYEYPYLMVEGETLHLVYSYFSRETMKHVVFTEAWIDGTAQVLDGDCKLWT